MQYAALKETLQIFWETPAPLESALPCSAPLPFCSQVFPQGNPWHQLTPEISTQDYIAAELP